MALRTAKLTSTSTIKWSDNEPFDGYVVVMVVAATDPSAVVYPYSTMDELGAVIQRLPDRFVVPIKNGAYDQTVKLYYNADLEPPNCRYAAYWFDTNNKRIAPSGAGTLFTITADPHTLDPPTLTVPTATATATQPEDPVTSSTTSSNYVTGGLNLTVVGAIPFTSSAGVLTDDPDNLFWDDSNNRLGIGTNAPTVPLTVSQATTGQSGVRIEMPTGAETTASGLRIKGFSPSLELIDKDSAQNWYIGIDDNNSDRLEIGRGYGPGQALLPHIWLNKVDSQVTIGPQSGSQTATGANLNVVSDADTSGGFGSNDNTLWVWRSGGAENLIRIQHYSKSAQSLPIIAGFGIRGTYAVPTATQNGDALMILDGRGHNGTTETDTRAGVHMYATENYTGSANGAQMKFYTTPNGGTTQTLRATIGHDGKVIIGSAAAATISGTGLLHLEGDTLRLQTSRTISASGDAGNAGEFCWDDNYLYVRHSSGWRRIALGGAF